MNKEEKNAMIGAISEKLQQNPNFYLTDASSLTVEKVNDLRRKCFNANISMMVVKNTLLHKAMERSDKNYSELFDTLKGATAILFSESGSAPAKLIKDFRKGGGDRPILKAAYVEECVYIGDKQLDTLASIKSKNELIGDIIGLLQSPAKNVISGLKASGGKLAGILSTLADKKE